MKTYIYPQNLNASANMGMWAMKDIAIIAIAALLSVIIGATTGWLIPGVAAMVYAFITIRLDDVTIKDYLSYVFHFVFGQRTYFWGGGKK